MDSLQKKWDDATRDKSNGVFAQYFTLLDYPLP